MGLFSKYFVEVKNGTKVTYSESDLRKLDRTYEKEVFPENKKRIMSPLNKVPQQAYLTQLRDYAFERVLDRHMYTFKHLLVVPNPYDIVKQSALLLFNSSKMRKVRYRVLGDTPEADFVGETEYTTRHRVPIMGLYLERSNKVILELIDEEENVVKRRLLRIFVGDSPKKIKDIITESHNNNLTQFPFILVNGVSFNPLVVDCNGVIRYSIQLRTNSIGMIPLEGGRFLYEDRTANRMNKRGYVKPCRYHEMDYMGRVYRTFLLDFPLSGVVAKNGNSLYMVSAETEVRINDKIIELDMTTGKVVKECLLADLVGTEYRNRGDWAIISNLSYHEKYLIITVKRLHTVIKLDWETMEIQWILAPKAVWKGTELEKYLLHGDVDTEQICRRPDSATIVEWDEEKGTERMLLFHEQSMGDVPLETEDNDKSAVLLLDIKGDERSFQSFGSHECIKNKRFGSAIYSEDKKRVLMCAGLRKNIIEGKKARFTELDNKTGEMYRYMYFRKAFNKIWLFKPDIAQAAKAVEVTDNVIFGSLNPPAVFEGELPPLAEERIERAYFSGAHLCEDLFLGNILPGRIDRIYFVGENHSYVQDYSGMVAARVKFPFAIPLNEMGIDEYHIYVESQGVVHRLKNEIRIVG